jgi:hypothetical protein
MDPAAMKSGLHPEGAHRDASLMARTRNGRDTCSPVASGCAILMRLSLPLGFASIRANTLSQRAKNR